jgi:uncharacterized protein (TIGR03435 family)
VNIERVLIFVVGIASMALAQAPVPAFEVASVKPNPAGGNRIETRPGELRITSATLTTCIVWAFRVQSSQVSGADAKVASELNSERYDIVAKSGDPASENELRVMLQNLLADRFKFAFHRQTREMRAYALQVDKRGPRFYESTGAGESMQQAKSKLIRQWKWTTMPQFAAVLSEAMEAAVEDQTGLTGKYDLSLDLTPYLSTDGARTELAGMMVTALREQLGLTVESRHVPIDVLVVDHVEHPSAN